MWHNIVNRTYATIIEFVIEMKQIYKDTVNIKSHLIQILLFSSLILSLNIIETVRIEGILGRPSKSGWLFASRWSNPIWSRFYQISGQLQVFALAFRSNRTCIHKHHTVVGNLFTSLFISSPLCDTSFGRRTSRRILTDPFDEP